MDTLWLVGFNQLGLCFPRKLCGLGRVRWKLFGPSGPMNVSSVQAFCLFIGCTWMIHGISLFLLLLVC